MSSPPPPSPIAATMSYGAGQWPGMQKGNCLCEGTGGHDWARGLGVRWGGEGRAGQMGELLGGIESDCKEGDHLKERRGHRMVW